MNTCDMHLVGSRATSSPIDRKSVELPEDIIKRFFQQMGFYLADTHREIKANEGDYITA
jgi:hypothetical protein